MTGRPIKLTADWFPHVAQASQGKTVSILENHFGAEGYAVWFKLLEVITGSRNHIVDVRNADSFEFLAAKLKVKPERLEEILVKLVALEGIDEGLWGVRVIWCQNLVDNLGPMYEHRHQPIPHKPDISVYNNVVPDNSKAITVSTNSTERVERESRERVPPISPRGFDEFWKLYPRKKSKGQAEKAWSSLKPNEQLVVAILQGIERAKTSESWRKDGGQYIPHPATWLRAKGWEDEIREGGKNDRTPIDGYTDPATLFDPD